MTKINLTKSFELKTCTEALAGNNASCSCLQGKPRLLSVWSAQIVGKLRDVQWCHWQSTVTYDNASEIIIYNLSYLEWNNIFSVISWTCLLSHVPCIRHFNVYYGCCLYGFYCLQIILKIYLWTLPVVTFMLLAIHQAKFWHSLNLIMKLISCWGKCILHDFQKAIHLVLFVYSLCYIIILCQY